MSKVKNPRSPWRASKRGTACCAVCGRQGRACECALPEMEPVAWWEVLASAVPARLSRVEVLEVLR